MAPEFSIEDYPPHRIHLISKLSFDFLHPLRPILDRLFCLVFISFYNSDVPPIATALPNLSKEADIELNRSMLVACSNFRPVMIALSESNAWNFSLTMKLMGSIGYDKLRYSIIQKQLLSIQATPIESKHPPNMNIPPNCLSRLFCNLQATFLSVSHSFL